MTTAGSLMLDRLRAICRNHRRNIVGGSIWLMIVLEAAYRPHWGDWFMILAAAVGYPAGAMDAIRDARDRNRRERRDAKIAALVRKGCGGGCG